MTEALESLMYPIGRFAAVRPDASQVEDAIERIESAPARLRAALSGLDEAQLETAYRPAGWTVSQVAQHLPDSHLNSYCRFKLALTEDAPAIRPYFEDRWANLPDVSIATLDLSLDLFEALHRRWTPLLRALGPEALERTFFHPESGDSIHLDTNVVLYAWHGDHHIAHITALRDRMQW